VVNDHCDTVLRREKGTHSGPIAATPLTSVIGCLLCIRTPAQCPYVVEKIPLDDLADRMRRGDVKLLNHGVSSLDAASRWSHSARIVTARGVAGEAGRDDTQRTGGGERRDHVGRFALGGDGDEHVARPAEPADLTLEHLVIAVVVADCGKHRSP
jgi:hypothetical protein